MRRYVWLIFKDEDRRLYEILGASSDDTNLTNKTAEMLDYDIYAQCDTPSADTPIEQSKEYFEKSGYQYKKGLFGELNNELEKRKFRGLKKHVRDR
jgi:hypothetical protein